MTFDAGKVGKATLHSISIDLRGTDSADDFGDTLELTLAVTPDYAFLLAGGDPKQRLESLLGPNGRLDAAAKPIVAVDVDVKRILAYAGAAAPATDEPAAAKAPAAGDTPTGQMRLFVRPLERGVATRLAAATDGAAGPGIPLGVPLPEGFPIPVPR
jgi:hypothetical protein